MTTQEPMSHQELHAADTPSAAMDKHFHFVRDHKRKAIGTIHHHHMADFHPVKDHGDLEEHLLAASDHASEPATPAGEAERLAGRVLFGKRLPEHLALLERLNPASALAILSSDALSSVAYATEAGLAVLVLGGAAAAHLNLGIGVAIALLMLIVGNSYRQTIFAYPHGGGSYTVASKNLGTLPGLVAAGSLLVDYLLTVSVSVAAGIDAIASVVPALQHLVVPLDVAAILVIMLVNLRGVREAGNVFAVPTYLFLFSFGLMLVVGIFRAVTSGGIAHAAPPVLHGVSGTQPITLMLILTAFASGCSAMTGVEAISNSVPVFTGKDVATQARNAARTLVTMIIILATFFLGTTFLAWRIGITPYPNGYPTVTSQLAAYAFNNGWFIYVVQITTLLILIFAANTSFAGFPRLASILARDQFLPPFFNYRGERLAFNTGIIALGALSIVVLVAFRGNVSDLINLYALGVFTAFTLSQIGLVRHWQRAREVTNKTWRIFANGLGAVVTGIVTIVIAVAKFDRGAWVVLILIPLLVFGFLSLRRYYARARIYHFEAPAGHAADIAIVPIFVQRDLREVLQYAQTVAPHVVAVRIVNDEHEAESFHRKWDQTVGKLIAEQHWPVQLEIVLEPYRTIVLPVARFMEWYSEHFPTERICVLLPVQEDPAWWEWPLHRRVARRVRAILQREKDNLPITVVNMPYTLQKGSQVNSAQVG